ncbi:lanthionine synthetase LanC family protein [Flavilitoribacter nigricans]|uniref:lanthionine synthetase LanC family protein n=1 Tax=Flavilitoribacter nigricans TaxID=70997 RepID=UPI001473BC33|nr:lanthionine synthetase LanC family protein [Flavilitoribacter nigricans]
MQEAYLNTAIRLGNRICRDAIRHQDKCNWIAATTETNYKSRSEPYYRALKGDWYSGTSGIAYFLAQLYCVSREPLHRKIAEEAMRQALDDVENIRHGKLGFYTGYTGIAYAAIRLGEQLESEEFIDRGLDLLNRMHRMDESDYNLDMIDGCAGAIPALIKLARNYPSDPLEQLLDRMGSYLLNRAVDEPHGCSWKTLEKGTKANLTGFAHGTSGIALALLELGHFQKNEAYIEAALAGFAYEESHFSEAEQNWPDFRDMSMYLPGEEEKTYYGNAWCHGAPGIGLARLRAYELTGKEILKTYAQRAVNTTIDHFDLTSLGNYSLCHGLFGNAETLLYASETLQDKTYRELVESAGYEMIEQVERKGTPPANGTQTEYFTPDMMLGLAGIGYFYLRLYDAGQFESVLMLT